MRLVSFPPPTQDERTNIPLDISMSSSYHFPIPWPLLRSSLVTIDLAYKSCLRFPNHKHRSAPATHHPSQSQSFHSPENKANRNGTRTHHINQRREISLVCLNQLRSIMLNPVRLVPPKIPRKSLLTPRTLNRV